MRAKAGIETFNKDRKAIVITEIPYQVNKARLVERIAQLVNDKVVDDISDIRDESDRDGMPALNFTGIHSEYSLTMMLKVSESISIRARPRFTSGRILKSARSSLPVPSGFSGPGI